MKSIVAQSSRGLKVPCLDLLSLSPDSYRTVRRKSFKFLCVMHRLRHAAARSKAPVAPQWSSRSCRPAWQSSSLGVGACLMLDLMLADQICSSTLAALRAATLVCTPGGCVAARLVPWLGPGWVLGSLDIAFFSCAHRTRPGPSPSAGEALWDGQQDTVIGSKRHRCGFRSVSAEALAARM